MKYERRFPAGNRLFWVLSRKEATPGPIFILFCTFSRKNIKRMGSECVKQAKEHDDTITKN